MPKTYLVIVNGMVDSQAVEKLKKGIWLAEGKTARSSVKILKRSHRQSSVEITIRQGINRQIRRMVAKVDLSVKSLARIRIGKLNTRGLGVGKFRALTKDEIAYLKKVTANPRTGSKNTTISTAGTFLTWTTKVKPPNR